MTPLFFNSYCILFKALKKNIVVQWKQVVTLGNTNLLWYAFLVYIDMSQGAVGDEVDGVVAVVAAVSSRKHKNSHSPSPVKVVVPASPESEVEVEEDGVALLTDAESPAVRSNGDLFASCQLLSDSFETGTGEFLYISFFLFTECDVLYRC